MTNLHTTLIISVYKDIAALAYILEALTRQTYKNFDVIVSEDGDSPEMRHFISGIHYPFKITHLSQPDIGWRKNKALNQSLLNTTGEYLVFIDGDCIPHSRFLETHSTLAQKNTVLSGKRVHIGQTIKNMIDNKTISLSDLESLSFYLKNIHKLSDSRSLEDALYVKPNSFIEKSLIRKISKIRGILGCNFSCFKQDILNINGFDEDYQAPNFGEDTDLQWRFEKIGVKLKSVRNTAILYHFRHPIRKDGFEQNKELMKKKIAKGEYFTPNGISKYL